VTVNTKKSGRYYAVVIYLSLGRYWILWICR